MDKTVEKPLIGQRFIISHTLERVRGGGKSKTVPTPGRLSLSRSNHPLESRRDYFLKSDDAQPFEAIYIGYRYVRDGRRWFEDEVGYLFSPTSQKLAYLFVFDPRRKPVLALPEHCKPIKENDNE